MKKVIGNYALALGALSSTVGPWSAMPSASIVAKSSVIAAVAVSASSPAYAQKGSRVCAYVVRSGIAQNPTASNQMQGFVDMWYFENHKNLKFTCLMMLNSFNPENSISISLGGGKWGYVVSNWVQNAMKKMLKKLGVGVGQQWTGSVCESFTTRVLKNDGWMQGNVCKRTEKYMPHMIRLWHNQKVQMWDENSGRRISPY